MLSFRELTCQDKGIHTQYYQASPVHYAEYSFFCLWGWSHAYPVEIAETGGALCWFRSGGPLPGMFGPIGNWDAVTDWDAELSHFKPGDVIYDVPAKVREILAGRSNLRFTEDRDQHEYVYAVKDMIALKGKAYAHKRNRVRAFLDGYEWDYYPITPVDFASIMDFQERWRARRMLTMTQEEADSLADEDEAIQKAFDRWSDFGLIGGMLKVDEEIVAYTIAQELDPQNLDVMFEKAVPEYAGSYQAINYMFLKEQGSGYTWVNREEDMGEPGLREAKMSYNPAFMLEKFQMEIL
ncbi:MAG: DUF2156 domain-containing protein [Synergistaceae bacterium]|nr:DUF2156 domain-containing protein [Synergistaceae bacterium]